MANVGDKHSVCVKGNTSEMPSDSWKKYISKYYLTAFEPGIKNDTDLNFLVINQNYGTAE